MGVNIADQVLMASSEGLQIVIMIVLPVVVGVMIVMICDQFAG